MSLIVVGPKDFPVFLRTVGRTISKIKGVAREFQGTMEDVATDMELDKIREANKNISNLESMDIEELSKMTKESKPQTIVNSVGTTPSDVKLRGSDTTSTPQGWSDGR